MQGSYEGYAHNPNPNVTDVLLEPNAQWFCLRSHAVFALDEIHITEVLLEHTKNDFYNLSYSCNGWSVFISVDSDMVECFFPGWPARLLRKETVQEVITCINGCIGGEVNR